jgi:hypothetical protein
MLEITLNGEMFHVLFRRFYTRIFFPRVADKNHCILTDSSHTTGTRTALDCNPYHRHLRGPAWDTGGRSGSLRHRLPSVVFYLSRFGLRRCSETQVPSSHQSLQETPSGLPHTWAIYGGVD